MRRDKFDFNRFLKCLRKSKEKDIINILNFSYEKHWNEGEEKFGYPANLNSLHGFFQMVDKKFKYETIFNVYDSLDKFVKVKSSFELGLLTCNFKKKYFFIIVYYQYQFESFYIDSKIKLKIKPDRKKLMDLTNLYIKGHYFPKIVWDKLERDDFGNPRKGTWGEKANFSHKLELKKYPYSHPLYHYSSINREHIEKTFMTYPNTKINYEFGKKNK